MVKLRNKNVNKILGYYSAKIDEKCKIPKVLKSTYIKNYIKYNNEDLITVNNNKKVHYIYQKDIQIMLSCANKDEENSEVIYTSKIIELPQCLIDLDSNNGFEYHKINFYLDIKEVIYDIYNDPRLKSFRNVGITFYEIEQYYIGLLFARIKRSTDKDYIAMEPNTIYLNVTHISFERVLPKYIPYFKKPFYLKYRLTNFDLKNTNDRITSNLCAFQIKFFPFYSNIKNIEIYIPVIYDIIPNVLPEIEIQQECNVEFCSQCMHNNNSDYCLICDTSEIQKLVLENNKCNCDTKLGFLKEPNKEFNLCLCQEYYFYYKTTNECKDKIILY